MVHFEVVYFIRLRYQLCIRVIGIIERLRLGWAPHRETQ